MFKLKKRILAFIIFFAVVFSVFSQTAGILTVNFKTSTYNGSYAPRHILAVWISTSGSSYTSTTFVKTLDAYYQNSQYVQYLARWKSASSLNTTDATTGATLNTHSSLTGTWNATNNVPATVSDGTYYVWIEFTESNSTGKYAVFSFTKDGNTSTAFINVTTSPYITVNSVSWTPSNTAVEEVEAGRNYKIFPNPVKDYLNITGSGLKISNVYNSVGKLIFTTTQNKINFSSFPMGAYVIEIVSSEGTFYRKVLKD